MENNLIKVTVKNDQQLVSARDLHKGLNLKRHFGDWVKQNFKDFEEDVDFMFAPGSANMPNGGVKRIIDYALTLDMAKQLCMMSHTELAKILKQNGVETLEVDGKTLAMGPNNLFKWMRANNYLISRKGTDYNSPTARAMNMGLFRIKESTHVSGDGVVKITKTPKVTGKGQQYFVNKFLQKEAINHD